MIHTALPVIADYDSILSSKEEAIGALNYLREKLVQGTKASSREIKPRYNDAMTKLKIFGNQTCNGHWLTNDIGLNEVTLKARKRLLRETIWSMHILI